ncbi:MAG: hypothetical protein Q8M24_23895 [Pseudolabrys sp.]|nr:hypothetical protein [Pseudolabrys sp.]MDP2298494.1 hypothetical protein [Pseudolabrys sp.]
MTGTIEAVRGRGLPLPGDDIDTDQIVESRYLKMTTFRGIETFVFESARRAARDGQGLPHPFDDARLAGASILLVGRNFGCGSSREHAPQALYRFGIRAIVGESFGEIFADNCMAIGLPCLPVAASDGRQLQSLCARVPDTELLADIRTGEITAGTQRICFSLAGGRRQRLLDGSWNALNVLLGAKGLIEMRLSELPPIQLAPQKGPQS